MEKEIEKIIRRIKVNSFYKNIKICCYKSAPNHKTDDLLKALGVNRLIYSNELMKPAKNKLVANAVNSIIDTSLVTWAAGVAH